MSWKSIPCCINELRLDIVLLCGQSFRWRQVEPGIFRSVLSNFVISLKQDEENLYYQVHNDDFCGAEPVKKSKKTSKVTKTADKQYNDSVESLLRDYFQLDISTAILYKNWAKTDSNFKNLSLDFNGIRVLRQDPVENLFSFICSSNNNIKRISSMVENLAKHYGQFLLTMDSVDYYSFPAVDKLAQKGVEEELRTLGFGYRAKFIARTAQYITGEKADWLNLLRSVCYEEAKAELVKLCGVGEKVADCVLLMSLDKPGAIPIDTHIAAVARQTYKLKLPETKTITHSMYKDIGDHFRSLWGEYAGWAQAVVFSADLPQFKPTTKAPTKSTKSKARKRKM